jgi:hypothetical protein
VVDPTIREGSKVSLNQRSPSLRPSRVRPCNLQFAPGVGQHRTDHHLDQTVTSGLEVPSDQRLSLIRDSDIQEFRRVVSSFLPECQVSKLQNLATRVLNDGRLRWTLAFSTPTMYPFTNREKPPGDTQSMDTCPS